MDFTHPQSQDTAAISLDLAEDRYSRLRLIPWWDQDLLRRSKVLVVGAGALGNEIIKNLALLGIGTVLVVDFDSVETSNLSRSVLYRASDDGKSKAAAAARSAKEINPDCSVFALDADVTSALGAGVFRWADVIICGLDNREARLAVNQACWKVNRPWVDGATQSMQGVARVFKPPDGVCYECTLSEQDAKLMAARDSCGFLAKEAHRHGGTPTTPTTSAVVAGIQVQEAVKLLHGDTAPSGLVGKGFFFDGTLYDCFTIEYVRKDDCLSHQTFEKIIETDLRSETSSLRDVIAVAGEHLGGRCVVDLPSEMVTELRCNPCASVQPFFRLLSAVDPEEATCPNCGSLRVPDVVTECSETSPFASLSLHDLGFPIMDVICARCGEQEIGIEISGDRNIVFGESNER